MRVIAGIHKGRQLKSVPGKTTRPTTDKVKEAVFQVMGPFFQGGICLDLFAGSGSLGMEALSRGMDHAIFIDRNPKSIQTIRDNIETLNVASKTEVFRADAFRAMHAAAKRNLQFSLILLDPPYGNVNYDKFLNEIIKLQLLMEDGLIYCEHDPSDRLPQLHNELEIIKHDTYGSSIAITIYRKGFQK